ncbi:MAG: PAS domain-containing protein [Candidatus Bathyarchaeota archaeon]|nr:PAS domain-containing protein [Candidatus Bathyarchaeota archaeon]
MSDVSSVVFDSISDGILVIDPDDYTVLTANRAVLEELRMEEAEVVGRPCYEVTHRFSSPCEPPDHTCPKREMLERGRSVTVEHTLYDVDGNPFWVEVSAHPVRDAEGNIVQVVHVTRDITERKRLEEELRDHERAGTGSLEGPRGG